MPKSNVPSKIVLISIGALAVLCTSFSLAAPLTIAIDAELETLIAGRDVIFVARELDGDRLLALDPARIDERHPPFSTFKIPNFLIALETGVITDVNAMREWDAARRPPTDFWPESWKQAHSLMTGFRHSAVWLFRDIALEVDGQRYRQDLARFNYGNEVAADGSDLFWLDGSLQISPLEQVKFLSRLLEDDLDVAPEHFALLRQASLIDESENCRLHGKTGAGPVEDDLDGPFEGWLVGWSQCADRPPTVFALWTRGRSFSAIRTFRQEAATALLTHIGAFGASQEKAMPSHTHHAIDYIEIPVTDLTEAKRFYGEAFAWAFNDYGDQYVGIRRHPDIADQEVGGFSPVESVQTGGILVILYSEDLEASLEQVRQAGGEITTEPFDFPGGRRFHFKDPAGNELAVWSTE